MLAPPPAVFLGCFVGGGLLELLWSSPAFPGWMRAGGLALFLGISAALIIAARLRFRSADTNVQPSQPATALVVDGIYGRTRNPMYLGLAAGHVGLALGLGSLWALLALVPALLVIHHGVVLREERYLEEKFGGEYLRYRARVARWI